MNLCRQEFPWKRRRLAVDFGNRKIITRSEKGMRLLRLQTHRRPPVRLRPLPSSTSNPTSSSSSPSSSSLPPALAAASSKKTSEPQSDEQRIDDLVLPRLRFLKQPITLFGEDDDARLDRLKLTLKSGVFDADSDMTEGQTNDFLGDVYELRKRQKAGSLLHDRAKDKRDDGDGIEGDGGDDDGDKDVSDDGGSSGMDADKDIKRMKANFEELCDEDKILVFFKRLLNEWNQELDEMPGADKQTAKGKQMIATFMQCARYLNPLFKFCRKKVSFFPQHIHCFTFFIVLHYFEHLFTNIL